MHDGFYQVVRTREDGVKERFGPLFDYNLIGAIEVLRFLSRQIREAGERGERVYFEIMAEGPGE